ncbi:MAG: hypothetical protein QXO74_04170 [Candidatus Methanomethylicia archaeon]
MIEIIINIIMVILATIMIEVRKLLLLPILLAAQGLLFTCSILLEGFSEHVFPIIFFSIFFSPFMVNYIIRRIHLSESNPLLPHIISIALLLLLVFLCISIQFLIFGIVDLNLIIIIIGVYGIIVKTDLRKIIACLSMIFMISHVFLEYLPLELSIILTFLSIFFLSFFIFFTLKFYLVSGKISTRDLKELRF